MLLVLHYIFNNYFKCKSHRFEILTKFKLKDHRGSRNQLLSCVKSRQRWQLETETLKCTTASLMMRIATLPVGMEMAWQESIAQTLVNWVLLSWIWSLSQRCRSLVFNGAQVQPPWRLQTCWLPQQLMVSWDTGIWPQANCCINRNRTQTTTSTPWTLTKTALY